MGNYQWFVFVLMAVVSWGSYVPTIHKGQLAFRSAPSVANPNESMRAFLFIGLAYFLLAVIIPGVWLMTHKEAADTGFTTRGSVISTIAGILGALGALGVVFALKFGGKPLYVAPLVFSGAPIVNVLVSMTWDPPGQAPRWQFFLGLALAVAGAALVLVYKPAAKKPGQAAVPIQSQTADFKTQI